MEIDTIGEDEICLLADTSQVVLPSEYLTLNRAPYIFTQDSSITVPAEHTLDEMGSTQYFPMQAYTVGLVDGQIVSNETTYLIDSSQFTFLTNGTHVLKAIQPLPNQEIVTTDGDILASVTADPNFLKVTEFVLQDNNIHLVNPIPQQALATEQLTSTDDSSFHQLAVPEDEDELLMESANIGELDASASSTQQQDFEQQTVEQEQDHHQQDEERLSEGEQAVHNHPISRIWTQDMNISPPLRKGPFTCDLCSKKLDTFTAFKKHLKSHLEDKPHRCKKCPATFNVASNLILHEAANHDTGNLSCPIKDCLKRFNRLASLKAHLTSHQQEESLFCTECGDEFNNQLQLDKHTTEHYQEWIKPPVKLYKCLHCERQYGKESILKEHMKCHYKMKTSLGVRKHKKLRRGLHLHECETCHKSFQKPSQLIRHKRIHTGEKPFKCDICSRAFNQKGSMKIHKLKHSGARPYQCEFCKAKFSQKGNLRAHVVRLHSISRSDEKVFKCQLCTCVFRKISRLNAHVNRTHRGESLDSTADKQGGNEVDKSSGKRVLLDMNDFLTAKDSSDKENDDRQNNLNCRSDTTGRLENDVEGRTSKPAAPIRERVKWTLPTADRACTYCKKEFKKPSDLVRHIRIHTHEKPFKCNQCFRSFAVRSTLTTHLRTHTGDKRHCCETCNKMFSSHSSLKVHLKSHLREKRYLCRHCLEAFSTLSERAVHIQTAHPTLEATLPSSLPSTEHSEQTDALQQATIVLPEPLVFTDGLMEIYVPNSSPKPPNPAPEERPYKCSVCYSTFTKSNSLKIHMRIHTGERPYKCDMCPRTCITNAVLKTHRNTHFGIKNNKCEECGKAFSTKSTLRRHMGTHRTVGKPFLCPYCNKNFKTRSSCKCHIKTHSTMAIAQMFEEAEQAETNAPEHQYVPEHIDNVTTTEEGHNVLNTSVESEEKVAVDAMLISQNSYQIPDGTEQGINVAQATHTLHSVPDTGETMMIPSLPIQEDLTQESIRVIQESLNNQIFSLSTEKEQSVNPNVLFDQPFDQMVFSAITTIPTDQITLEQGSTYLASSNNLRSLLADKTIHHSLESVNVHLESEDEHRQHEVALPLAEEHVSEATGTVMVDAANLISVVNEGQATFHLNSSDNNQDGAKKPRCEVCDQTFNTQAQLRAHEKNHGKQKLFDCLLCGTSFTTSASLNRHTKAIHTDIKSVSCKECVAVFRTESQLKRHMLDHHGAKVGRGMAGKWGGGGRRRGGRGEARQLTEEETKRLLGQQLLPGASVSEKVLIQSVAERGTISELKNPNRLTCTEIHPNRCKFCPKSFRKPSDLARHLRIHTGERPFQCHYCYKSFTVKSTLHSHIKTHISTKQFICHVCSSPFATKGSLKVHMRLHTGSKPFRCPMCDMRFRTSGHRKAHLMMHVKEGDMKQQQLRSASEMFIQQSMQQQVAQPEKQQLQPVDDEEEEEEEEEEQEQEEEDQTLEVAGSDENGDALFQIFDHVTAIDCDDTSATPQTTVVLIPSKLSPAVNKLKGELVCNICSKEFSKASCLSRHMRIHTGERPFKCDECGKMFNQKNAMQIHRQRHSGEKPWKCPECEISLTQKGNLKTHLRRSHQFSPHTTALSKQQKQVKSVFNLEFDNVIGDIFSPENSGVSVTV